MCSYPGSYPPPRCDTQPGSMRRIPSEAHTHPGCNQCAHTQSHAHRTYERRVVGTHRSSYPPPRCDTQPAACATEMLYAHEFYWDRHKARSSTLGAPTPPTPPPPSLPPPALPPEPPLPLTPGHRLLQAAPSAICGGGTRTGLRSSRCSRAPTHPHPRACSRCSGYFPTRRCGSMATRSPRRCARPPFAHS